MTKHNRLKWEFLDWLKQKGEERGYSPEVYRGIEGGELRDGSRLIVRARASTQQRDPIRLKVNREVNSHAGEFDSAFSVLVKARDSSSWSPEYDHFYPLSLRYFKHQAGTDRNGDNPIAIHTQQRPVSAWKDDLDRLFPPSGGETSSDVEPSGRMANLNRIAEKYC